MTLSPIYNRLKLLRLQGHLGELWGAIQPGGFRQNAVSIANLRYYGRSGIMFMAFCSQKPVQTVWAVLLVVMGLLLCIKTPYAVRISRGAPFLNFARYFIALFLVIGGVRKLYILYTLKGEKSPPDK